VNARSPWGAALVLLLAVAAGCTGRERTNPFDPANPGTAGEPEALTARAACGRVDLAWDDLGMRDLTGFRLWRTVAGASEALLTPEPLDRARRAYADESAENGTEYRYRVEFLFGAASSWAVPVTARPGPALPWSIDPCGWGLARLSPDGRTLEEIAHEGSMVVDADVDGAGHRVFAAALTYPARVIVVPSAGPGPGRDLPLTGVTCVSWSGAAGALAAGAFFERRVTWMTDDGAVLGELATDGYPEDVALRDAGCTWIALADASQRDGRLLRGPLGGAAGEFRAVRVARPVAVADDPGRGCWVADHAGGVAYVSDSLAVTRSAPGVVLEPADLSADGAGACWAADPRAGAIVQLDRDCVVQRRVDGLAGVTGVTCDPISGTVWVALPDAGRVICREIAAGRTVGEIFLSGCPSKVVGDWTGGCPPRASGAPAPAPRPAGRAPGAAARSCGR
jgi:streptogramin lyase